MVIGAYDFYIIKCIIFAESTMFIAGDERCYRHLAAIGCNSSDSWSYCHSSHMFVVTV